MWGITDMRGAIIWAAALMILSQPVFAQEVDCKNPPDQLTMNTCAEKDYKASDKKLNDTYHALMAAISKPGQAKLQKAQRSWVAYRDAQCDFDTMGTSTGSIHPMIQLACLSGLTQMQTEHLNQQLHCQEGDTACGGQ
jgi:uncharacterized protein YecT (DUF1311 family)